MPGRGYISLRDYCARKTYDLTELSRKALSKGLPIIAAFHEGQAAAHLEMQAQLQDIINEKNREIDDTPTDASGGDRKGQ